MYGEAGAAAIFDTFQHDSGNGMLCLSKSYLNDGNIFSILVDNNSFIERPRSKLIILKKQGLF